MKKLALASIRFYQHLPVPSLHAACRFNPTCSEYTYQAIVKYGTLKGISLGIKRLAHCHPFTSAHYDSSLK